jgi:hypothetical protein
MEMPLIVVDGNDVGLFTSAAALTSKLEPPDVRAGTLAAYDSGGRLLELGTVAGRVERVVVVSADGGPQHEPQMRDALIDGLVAGFAEDADALRLLSSRELIERAVERFGFMD